MVGLERVKRKWNCIGAKNFLFAAAGASTLQLPVIQPSMPGRGHTGLWHFGGDSSLVSVLNRGAICHLLRN